MRYIFAVLLSLYGVGTSIADEETMADSSAMKQDDAVDLSGGELASLHSDAYHVLARPWYQKVELSGFGAFWFADSGADGTRPEAGFVIKESALFVEAEVWEEMTLFFELQTTALQRDHNSSVRTGEIYVHFRDLLKRWGAGRMGFKIGRVDIPFGEEYLWQDAPDNSLISNSAAYPWLWDEGVVLYGEWAGGRLGWIASIMDGTRSRSQEDNAAKALNAKIHGSPWETLYLSASAMRNGDAAESAILLGGSFLKPVGADDATSSVGESPSDVVDTRLYQIDAQWKPARATRFDLAAGGAFVDDAVEAFDRDLRWFMLQARQGFGGGFYAVARYSEIGTYDDQEGYSLGGEFLAGGRRAFGYDARRLQRSSLGLGWEFNARGRLKLELGRDRFEVIVASPFDPEGDDRAFYVFELVASF